LRRRGAGKRRREEDAREYTELESEEACQGSRRGRAVWCEVLEKGEQSLIEKEADKKEKRSNLRRRKIYSN